ncbi:anthranilate phosphoribosyltransferase [Dermacoccaceae bacterium W4C1]
MSAASTPGPGPTWASVIGQLMRGQDLQAHEASWAMDQMLQGAASQAQTAGFLVALRAKGETVAELSGLSAAMIDNAVPIEVDGPTLDIVGTGGDQAHTVNISTMSAVVAAGAGARVVKHGNRAASSSSGAADVLEALGVTLDLTPEQVRRCALEAGITFCFAQTFHPSMRHAGPVRAELGVPTSLNVLGPLTNPARPRFSAIGVADARLAPLMAQVFAQAGRSAAVFRGDDGLDELTLTTTSSVWWVHDGELSEHTVDPAALGLTPVPIEELRGGDAAHNAEVARQVFAGSTGPVREAVLLNAGMALARTQVEPGGARFGSHPDLDSLLADGIQRAAASIDSGAATAALESWVRTSEALRQGS